MFRNLLLIMLMACLCFHWLEKTANAGEDGLLMGVTEKVEVNRGGRSSWEPAIGGTAVAIGDRVRTGAGSQAYVRFGSVLINLLENSIIEFSPGPASRIKKRRGNRNPRDIVLQMGQGIVNFTRAKSKLNVRVVTPEMFIGNSRAKFHVWADPELRAVAVYEGKIRVEIRACGGRPVEVAAGSFSAVVDNRLVGFVPFTVKEPRRIQMEIENWLRQTIFSSPKPENNCPTLNEASQALEPVSHSAGQPKPENSVQNRISIKPSVTVFRLSDDNTTFSRDSEQSDVLTGVAPGLDLDLSSGVIEGKTEYKAVIEYYEKNRDLNHTKHFAELESVLRFRPKAAVRIRDRFAFTPDSTEFPSTNIAVPRGEALYANTLDFGMDLLGLTLAYNQIDEHYDSNLLSDGVARRVEERVILPVLGSAMIVQSYRMRYYRQWVLDRYRTVFRSHSAGLGVRHYLTEKSFIGLEGGAAHWRSSTDESFRTEGMGLAEMVYESNSDPGEGNVRLHLSYREDVESLWTVAFDFLEGMSTYGINYSREIILGTGVLLGKYVREDISLKVGQAMHDALRLQLGGGYSRVRSGVDNLPEFKVYHADVELNFILASWIEARLGYRFHLQDSQNLAGLQEFARNQAIVGLSVLAP